MMAPSPAARRAAMAPLHRTALLPCAQATALAAVLAGGLAARAAEKPYPPATTFREVQRLILTCGRENTPASCGQARALADPLLDHPRLTSSCKDALWSVRQRAVVASANSLARRDAIDQASRDVGSFCRQPQQAGAAPGGATSGGATPGGAPGGGDKPSGMAFPMMGPANP